MKCKDCKRPARKGRKLCYRCAQRRWREADPVRASFHNLKAHARERGKVFTITLEYFRAFCIRTDYITGKGRSADSYHVDRIDEALGYIEGNLQVLTNTANVVKYLNYDWATGTAKVYKGVKGGYNDEENLPF